MKKIGFSIFGFLSVLVISSLIYWVLSSLLAETTLSGGHLKTYDYLLTFVVSFIPLLIFLIINGVLIIKRKAKK